MYRTRIDEITVTREQPQTRSRTFLPMVPPDREMALGRAFGFAEITVPRTPQVDEILAGIDHELTHAYTNGVLRPGETPELFFENIVRRICDGITDYIHEHRLRISNDSMTLLFGCVSGSCVYMTGRGTAQAFLIRRAPQGQSQATDLFRGMADDPGPRLLVNLLTGNITPQDVILFGNRTLTETVAVPEIVRAAEKTESAGIAAYLRTQIVHARPVGPAIGLLVRITPMDRPLSTEDNPSVQAMVSREEEVARVLSPAGVPHVHTLLARFKKPKKQVPVPPIERFNALTRRNKISALVLMSLVAIFLVSLQIRAVQNKGREREAAYQSAVLAVRAINDQAEGSLIYDENRARELAGEARTKFDALPQKSKREKQVAAALEGDIISLERRLSHIIDPELRVLATLPGPGSVLSGRGATLFLSAGTDLLQIDASGNTTTLVNLVSAPRWLVDDGKLLYAWLENGTLVSIDPSKKSSAAVSYDGPPAPRDAGMWNERLYVLSEDGRQIVKLPRTLSGFGRGAQWLKEEIPGPGGQSMAIDGTIFVHIPGDAIRQYERGSALPFAATGSDTLTDGRRLVITPSSIYLLGANRTIAAWDRTGKLIAQYVLGETHGIPMAFTVDETKKQATLVTDIGAVLQFDLSHLK